MLVTRQLGVALCRRLASPNPVRSVHLLKHCYQKNMHNHVKMSGLATVHEELGT